MANYDREAYIYQMGQDLNGADRQVLHTLRPECLSCPEIVKLVGRLSMWRGSESPDSPAHARAVREQLSALALATHTADHTVAAYKNAAERPLTLFSDLPLTARALPGLPEGAYAAIKLEMETGSLPEGSYHHTNNIPDSGLRKSRVMKHHKLGTYDRAGDIELTLRLPSRRALRVFSFFRQHLALPGSSTLDDSYPFVAYCTGLPEDITQNRACGVAYDEKALVPEQFEPYLVNGEPYGMFTEILAAQSSSRSKLFKSKQKERP